uniref:Amidase domain-containing protein n=1 Tax=Hyaloperonospora arabidopsidis (strain Emoy2) TaxID=559515 RepID=M4BH83_HYAAE
MHASPWRRYGAYVPKLARRDASSSRVSDWCSQTLLDVSDALAQGRVSAVEVTEACIQQVERTRRFNMFVSTDFERALALAKASDERRAAGKSLGLLDGIPIGVKDVYCMENVPTTAGSHMLEGFVAPYESTVTQRLLDQGAVPLGKLNMDEFAMGSGTLYSKFGATINPWSKDFGDQAVVAGGSSGGSAAAVASGCCFAALGSDTGGSVRQPTYGRVSRHEYYVRELPEEIVNVWNQGIEWLRSAGAQVVSLSLPTTKLCIPAYYILACAEASSNLSRYDGVRYGQSMSLWSRRKTNPMLFMTCTVEQDRRRLEKKSSDGSFQVHLCSQLVL